MASFVLPQFMMDIVEVDFFFLLPLGMRENRVRGNVMVKILG